MKAAELAERIDHSLLKPDASDEDIKRLCDEAKKFGFHAVCVNPYFIPFSKELLSGSGVKTAAVIGFPFGMTLTGAKAFEAAEAVKAGADELDIVMNIGMAKSGNWDAVRKDILEVLSAAKNVVRKIIIEACYLTGDEKIRASQIILESGAEFIKTSTGFGPAGATVGDVRLIKSVVKNSCGIKAAGGIKTLSQVKEFISAGATRIGTSAGVAIMQEFNKLSF